MCSFTSSCPATGCKGKPVAVGIAVGGRLAEVAPYDRFLISAPRLGVYYFCRWLCLSVRVYVCHPPSNRFFLFVLFLDGIEPLFGLQYSIHVVLYKTAFFDFWFRPPNSQNLLPKIWHKIAYRSACMEDRPEMFGPTGGFRGWPIQWNHTKCCGADPWCHGNEIWPIGAEI